MDYQLLRNDRGAWCLVLDQIDAQRSSALRLEVGFDGLTLHRDRGSIALPPLDDAALVRMLRDLGPDGGPILVAEVDQDGAVTTSEGRLGLSGGAA